MAQGLLKKLSTWKSSYESLYPISFRIKTISWKFGIKKPCSVLRSWELEKKIKTVDKKTKFSVS